MRTVPSPRDRDDGKGAIAVEEYACVQADGHTSSRSSPREPCFSRGHDSLTKSEQSSDAATKQKDGDFQSRWHGPHRWLIWTLSNRHLEACVIYLKTTVKEGPTILEDHSPSPWSRTAWSPDGCHRVLQGRIDGFILFHHVSSRGVSTVCRTTRRGGSRLLAASADGRSPARMGTYQSRHRAHLNSVGEPIGARAPSPELRLGRADLPRWLRSVRGGAATRLLPAGCGSLEGLDLRAGAAAATSDAG